MNLKEWVNNYVKEVTHSHEYEDMSGMGEHHSDNPNDMYVVKPCDEEGFPFAVWEGDVKVDHFKTKEEAQAFADKQNKEQGLTEADENPTDVITMDVPLFIRILEYAREDAKTDMDLHNTTQNAIQLMKTTTPLTMVNYDTIVGTDSNVSEGSESDSDMATKQLETSVKKAQELINKLRGKGDLEPWVQSLITKAEDYISTVTDYSDVDEYDVETIDELNDFHNFMKEYKSNLTEAEYQGRKVELGKIMQGDVKKFKVYVNNDKGNVVKVNFGQKGMVIKKDNPDARKSFRARMNCDSPGPRWKARYWSCRKW